MMHPQIRQRIAADIARVGHSVMGVFPVEGDERQHWIAYTVGLTATFDYELLMVGIAGPAAMHLLNAIAEAGTVELDKPTMAFGTALPIKFMKCNANLVSLHNHYVVQADQFYGKRVDVVQVVLCDRNGKFPGDPEYEYDYRMPLQPLFFNYALH